MSYKPRPAVSLPGKRLLRNVDIGDEGLVRNYLVENSLASRLPRKILFWDETMRDGEQTPGVAFTPEEKLQIATQLDVMGVPIMDVGIPVVSKEEARGVKLVEQFEHFVAGAGIEVSRRLVGQQ